MPQENEINQAVVEYDAILWWADLDYKERINYRELFSGGNLMPLDSIVWLYLKYNPDVVVA